MKESIFFKNKVNIDIVTLIKAVLISLLPCISVDFSAYAYDNTIHPVLIQAKCFGSNVEYITTLNGLIIIYPLMIFSVYLILCLVKRNVVIPRGLKKWALLLAVGMALGRIIGNSYFYLCSWDMIKNGLGWSALFLICYWILFYEIILLFYYLLEKCNSSCKQKKSIPNNYFMLWVIFMIAWLPRLILMYPFHMEIDTAVSYWEAMLALNTNGYTVLIALMKAIFLFGRMIGSYENGLFIYLCLIYLFATLLWAYVFYFFRDQISDKVFLFFLLCVLFFPYYQMWSVYISKDVQYGVAETFLIFILAIFLLKKKEHIGIMLSLVGLFLCLNLLCFRKNGVIDIVVTILSYIVFVTFTKDRKKCIRAITSMLVVIMVIIGLITVSGRESIIYSIVVNPWNYYLERLNYSISADTLGRNLVAMQDDEWPQEQLEIIGDFLDEYSKSKYTATAPTNYITIIEGLDNETKSRLYDYLKKTEPALLIQAGIASRYCYFDVGEWVYDSTMVQILDAPIWDSKLETKFLYEKLVEYSDRFDFLNDGYRKILTFPVVSILSNVGVYVWMLIACFVYFVYKKKYQVFVFGMPLICCLVGGLLSGYNAVPRLCIPLILSTPIFVMLCMSLGEGDNAEGSV